MKYINADKLIAEIENTIKAAKKEMEDRDVDSYSDSPYDEKIYARINSTIETCEDIIDTITSLQQEQPEADSEKLGEIARHLIAVKDHEEDMRLDEGEWLLLERIGYPERFNAKKEE